MSEISEGQGLHFVKVTNKNGFPLPLDYFDGVPYKFPPNEPQSIPADAAGHFFGYPGEPELMKQHTCRRYGWNTPEMILTGADGVSQADRFFSKLEFKAVIYELVEKADPSPNEPIAADAGEEIYQREANPTAMLVPAGEPETRSTPQERRDARATRRVLRKFGGGANAAPK